MYYDYLQFLRDNSIDIHELNTRSDSSSSTFSENTVLRIPSIDSDDKLQKSFINMPNGTLDPSSDITPGRRARSPLPPLRLHSESEIDLNGLRLDEDEFLKNEIQSDSLNAARAHWIQLYKQNQQHTVIQEVFIHMIRNYPQMRPVWQFSRALNIKDDNWKEELQKDSTFKHHCSSLQAAFTMIMDNLDEDNGVSRLLHQLGQHHFYYDAYEPHLELFQESLLEALKTVLFDTNEAPDENLLRAWTRFFIMVKKSINAGIAHQRRNYLVQCVTALEMKYVKKVWGQVKEYGLDKAGAVCTRIALQTYEELLDKYKIDMTLNLKEEDADFKKFSIEIIRALEITINYYSVEHGFVQLPSILSEFVNTCLVMNVCPTLVRKAFMEGLVGMLAQVLGEPIIEESSVHTWSKVYRVLEQAILTNIVEF
ncbi:unnamed protein product [Bursaphelenchus okinawaensis]|uniref:Globin domain-containing protein n=1 Tax=Bursaphelenchus okinawaensis TaxID=465554 RepID=A0A811LDC0_9BILA|nr:unnamed protein product [Bursaphelenchus okinawaensis]CAG9121829.1 unnamed protein product [Bursaphelenchus okinawaensis]